MTKVPFKIGEAYYGYNDGKACVDRRVEIVVDDIVERDNLSKYYIGKWHAALKKDFNDAYDGCIHYLLDANNETNQFWDWNCDMFVFGYIVGRKDTKKTPMIFAARPKGYGWYCVNWNYSIENRKVKKGEAK